MSVVNCPNCGEQFAVDATSDRPNEMSLWSKAGLEVYVLSLQNNFKIPEEDLELLRGMGASIEEVYMTKGRVKVWWFFVPAPENSYFAYEITSRKSVYIDQFFISKPRE